MKRGESTGECIQERLIRIRRSLTDQDVRGVCREEIAKASGAAIRLSIVSRIMIIVFWIHIEMILQILSRQGGHRGRLDIGQPSVAAPLRRSGKRR